MTALLVRLGQKIAREIKNPANKHNPKVLLDIKLFLAVKDAVEKTQGLMMAGSIAIKRAKTDEEKEAVQAAVKKGMSKVEATLKSKMLALEKQAIVLAVAAAKAKKHPKKPAAEATEDADAPQDGSPKDSAKNNHPEISAADIDSIFAEAGPDPKDAAADATEEEVPHLRTH